MIAVRTHAAPALAGMLLLAGTLACGGESPEARLDEALEAVEEARSDVRERTEELSEERAELDRCRSELAAAQQELDEARRAMMSAEQRLERRTTDVAIFRSVQGALLEAKELKSAGIRAEVNQGVVTLRGEVEHAKQSERAEKLARRTAGVERVQNEIRVVGDAGGEGR
jgi:osmotically-inducible protein OsmY